MEKWKHRIRLQLQKAGKSGLGLKELSARCKAKREDMGAFRAALRACQKDGEICERNGRYALDPKGCVPAVIKRLHGTYAFAERTDEPGEVFILGSRLMGALPGDRVQLKLSSSPKGDLPEGEVVDILEEGPSTFAGIVTLGSYGATIRPDTLGKVDIRLVGDLSGVRTGDKVLAQIAKRGASHREHRAKVLVNYGSAEEASVCCAAILGEAGISADFPAAVLDDAKFLAHRGILEEELWSREDLRSETIFTIDSADSKDLDDAVSLHKYDTFYQLGVHIADVSHYVKARSPLDDEAFARGTSVYYANRVAPMLPPDLSNGICSLNPGEDRLAFSALLTLSLDGKLLDFDFKKSVIHSRVKGVYSEVNKILDGTADEALLEKYRDVRGMIPVMKELKDILVRNRKNRGAPDLETSESKLIMDEAGKTIDVMPRTRGEAEVIVEEFMLLANEAAATLAKKAEIPFVYRVHELPDPERIDSLKDAVTALGGSGARLEGRVPASVLADLLNAARDKDYYPILNRMVLRSMAKAKYSEHPIGHYGLVLENYAHFTSPIRRYPDLTIHRILTDLLAGASKEELNKRYGSFAARSAEHSTETEITAMQVERSCEDCCKAEYMQSHVGEFYDAIISGVTSFGFYVELPNTVEGLVRVESLPDGEYVFDGMMALTEIQGGGCYRIGDRVRVRCTGADVSAGNVDFVLEGHA